MVLGETRASIEIPPAEGVAKAEEAAAIDATDSAAEVQSQPARDETNVWPTEAEEAAFLAETGERAQPVAVATVTARANNDEADESSKPLPKLDDLVNRIPADARELLDELFRAKFTTVRRVKKRDLKS